MHRSGMRGSPEHEAKLWLDKLAEVDRKRARYQEMAAEDLITLDELREKLGGLEDVGAAAERELEEVQGRAGLISELEQNRDALITSYEALAPEELDDLSLEERHSFYRTLHVAVYAHPEGDVEVTGEFMPFGGSESEDPPDDPSGGKPGNNGTDPGRSDGSSTLNRRGFSTNINTRGYGAGAKALQ